MGTHKHVRSNWSITSVDLKQVYPCLFTNLQLGIGWPRGHDYLQPDFLAIFLAQEDIGTVSVGISLHFHCHHVPEDVLDTLTAFAFGTIFNIKRANGSCLRCFRLNNLNNSALLLQCSIPSGHPPVPML